MADVKVGQLREPYSPPAGRVHPGRVRVVGRVGDRFRISDAKAATHVFSSKTIEKRWPVVVAGRPTADYPKERDHSG